MTLDLKKIKLYYKIRTIVTPKMLPFIKIPIELAFNDKKCIFAHLINRGREPQNLIKRLCQ